MFYCVDVGYDLCGPPIASPGSVLLHHRKNYVFRVVDGPIAENVLPAPDIPAVGDAPAWKAVSTDDENISKIALLGPAGDKVAGKVFFNFAWSEELTNAISTGEAPSDGGEAVVMEGTLDEAVHRAALMILKKGRQGNFAVNIFGHEDLPAGISLDTTLTLEQGEEMQSDDNHFVNARVMVNNMKLILYQPAHEGEDEEKVLRRRIWKYTWWSKGELPSDHAVYTVRKVVRKVPNVAESK